MLDPGHDRSKVRERPEQYRWMVDALACPPLKWSTGIPALARTGYRDQPRSAKHAASCLAMPLDARSASATTEVPIASSATCRLPLTRVCRVRPAGPIDATALAPAHLHQAELAARPLVEGEEAGVD